MEKELSRERHFPYGSTLSFVLLFSQTLDEPNAVAATESIKFKVAFVSRVTKDIPTDFDIS